MSTAKSRMKRLRASAKKNNGLSTGVRVASVTRAYVRIHRPERGEAIGRAITEAMDPSRAPGEVLTGADLRARVAAEMGVAVSSRRRCAVEGCAEEPGKGYRVCRTHGQKARRGR